MASLRVDSCGGVAGKTDTTSDENVNGSEHTDRQAIVPAAERPQREGRQVKHSDKNKREEPAVRASWAAGEGADQRHLARSCSLEGVQPIASRMEESASSFVLANPERQHLFPSTLSRAGPVTVVGVETRRRVSLWRARSAAL